MDPVRVYAASVKGLREHDEIYERYYDSAPDDRKRKADAYHLAEDRARSIGVWALWEKVRAEGDEENKNFSHSGEYVLVSVAGPEENVGCDVETSGRYREGVVRRFFTKDEAEDVLSRSEEERPGRFLRYWVLKESFLKFTREGLGGDMRSFSIVLPEEDGGEVKISYGPERRMEKERCPEVYFREFVLEGARAAVCASCSKIGDLEMIRLE